MWSILLTGVVLNEHSTMNRKGRTRFFVWRKYHGALFVMKVPLYDSKNWESVILWLKFTFSHNFKLLKTSMESASLWLELSVIL